MTHEQLMAYYGETMRLCMIYSKLASADMTKEGQEADRNIEAFDAQLEAAREVTQAWDMGMLEDVNINVTNEGQCREIEAIARERLTSQTVNIEGMVLWQNQNQN